MDTGTTSIIYINSETSKCPNCKKDEDIKIKQVCRNCGYEYPDTPTWRDIILSILFFGGLAWIVLTVLAWLFIYHNESLLKIITSQYIWLKELKIW